MSAMQTHLWTCSHGMLVLQYINKHVQRRNVDKGFQMRPVLFVGSNPSIHCFNPSVAFVGTKSLTTLELWISEIRLNMQYYFPYHMANASSRITSTPKISDMDLESLGIYCEYVQPFAVIALGKYAVKACKKMGWEYFELPHPSGLNRKLNDKNYVKTALKQCSDYLSNKLMEYK